MLVDLLLVILLGAAWGVLERPRWRELLPSFALLRSSCSRQPLLALLGGALLLSLCAWAQVTTLYGPAAILRFVAGGPTPAEREACFRLQRAAPESPAETYEVRAPSCPLGGGVYVRKQDGLHCAVHGRAE
jgi:hypothetical protein